MEYTGEEIRIVLDESFDEVDATFDTDFSHESYGRDLIAEIKSRLIKIGLKKSEKQFRNRQD